MALFLAHVITHTHQVEWHIGYKIYTRVCSPEAFGRELLAFFFQAFSLHMSLAFFRKYNSTRLKDLEEHLSYQIPAFSRLAMMS